MSILHTINSSPFQTLALQQCLGLLNDEDCILLIEDAVVSCQAKHAFIDELTELSQQGRLMVLKEDLDARGIDNKIGKHCSYVDFVNLTIQHESQIAW